VCGVCVCGVCVCVCVWCVCGVCVVCVCVWCVCACVVCVYACVCMYYWQELQSQHSVYETEKNHEVSITTVSTCYSKIVSAERKYWGQNLMCIVFKYSIRTAQ